MWATVNPSHEAKEEKYAELSKKGILDEIEKLFMAKEIKDITKKREKKSDKKQVMASNLMQTFQIALATFSQMPVEDLTRMIIHCDKEILENNVVMEFLQKDDLCNISDNTAKLMAPYSKDWTGPDAINTPREQDPAELTREDQLYLYTAFELHHYWKSRMRALALSRTFEPEYDEISAKLKQVVDVSESLRNSVKLMPVFGLILDIGNYMNDSNKQAIGFRLTSLARLGMVKDDKNELTLMDYIEKVVRKQYPQYEDFTEDISGVTTAARLNVDQLEVDARRYIDNIRNVQASLDSGNLSDPRKFHPEDRVSQVAQRSMKEARRKAEQMQLYLDETKRTFNDILTFFGDDNADENARREFFAKLSNFVVEYKKSREKNTVMEENQRRTEASMRRKQGNMTSAASLSQLDAMEAPPSPNPTGAMDTLLEKLRAAAPSTRDVRDRRRRNRLNDRHQRRVASGQKIPDLPDIETTDMPPEEMGTLSPKEEEQDSLAPPEEQEKGAVSEGEDVADRAATLLQGLRGNGEGEGIRRDESLRVRRRRESADTERTRRRERRRANNRDTRDTTDGGLQSPTIHEDGASMAEGLGIETGTDELTEEPAELHADGAQEIEHRSVLDKPPQLQTPEVGLDFGFGSAFGSDDRPESSLPSPPVTVIVPPSPTTPDGEVGEGFGTPPEER